MSLGEMDWKVLSIVVILSWLILRPFFKRHFERRLRKKKVLGKNENLKNRF